MSSLVAYLEPPIPSDPARAQAILRDAPRFFALKKRDFKFPYPFNLLMSSESQEKWVAYENIFISSIQTGDYSLAKECVEALTERFGKLNERVIILKGLYDEAIATSDDERRAILKRYEDIITESPTMFGVRKRRVALLKSLGKTTDAIAALVEILDASPTDAEAWVELADLYQSQGAIDQTIFSLEETLLVVPNAWNIHAKLGEVLYSSASRSEGPERIKYLSESVRRFCRSVELSSDYLRGYYGLKQATTRFLSLTQAEAPTDESLLSTSVAQKLNELATKKLAEAVRKSGSGEKGWNGYNEAELLAAKAFLSQDTPNITR